jgi:hypothetical protein
MAEKFAWPPQSRIEALPLEREAESPPPSERALWLSVIGDDSPPPAKRRHYPAWLIAAGLALGVVSVASYQAWGYFRLSESAPSTPAAPVVIAGRDIPLSPENNGVPPGSRLRATSSEAAPRLLPAAPQRALPGGVPLATETPGLGPRPAAAAAPGGVSAAEGAEAGVPAIEAAEAGAPDSAGPVDGDIYSPADAGVMPPKLLSRGFVAPRAEGLGLSSTSSIELWISETGSVERVRLLAPSRTMSDAMLLSRAKQFTFAPAIRGNTPVPYRIVLSIEVGP